MAKCSKEDQAQAIEWLRKNTKLKTRFYIVHKHTSASGMFREFMVLIVKDKEIMDISWRVANALGDKLGKRGGVGIQGCGMDMAFHLVYTLIQTLWHNKKDLSGHVNYRFIG